jgi:phosphohistidine phosphatase
MQLFLIRHAAAAPRSRAGSDAQRPLTLQGRRRWELAVRGLQSLGVRFDTVLHSPWLRAVETAALLAPLVDGELAASAELAHAPTPELFAKLDAERVALVGHQPWLGELAGLLLFGEPRAGGRLVLKKGSVAWLEGDSRAGGMSLVALMPPRWLRRAGRR